MNDTHISGRYVVVGGGVAGVTCAREIARLHGDDSVVLVTKGNIVKNSEVVEAYSEYMEDVRVRLEKGREETFGDLKNVSCVDGVVVEMDVVEKRLLLDSGEVVLYDKVCICSGASPKRVLESDEVMTLRDTDSILSVGERLAKCGSLMVVGNGGIALDLVAAIWDIETYWIVKHESIGDAFFDAEVGEFFMEELWYSRKHGGEPCSRRCHGESRTAPGASVGPAWTEQLQRHGKMGEVSQPLHIETTCEVRNIMKDISSGKYWVDLSNGTRVCVDLVISAIGVDPTQNVSWVPSCVQRAFDGGLLVSKDMKTSFRDVFAAGDACTVETEKDTPWFQMRLWSQARAMGQRAAHCMLGIQDQMASELAFDLFVHVTHFLGKRVILLGCFNGQTLNESASPIKFYSRVMNELPHRNFVRVVIQDGRMKGAICIGDTGLEETLENLIMDGIDVSAFGPDILDPDRGLEDIFD